MEKYSKEFLMGLKCAPDNSSTCPHCNEKLLNDVKREFIDTTKYSNFKIRKPAKSKDGIVFWEYYVYTCDKCKNQFSMHEYEK